MCTWTHATHSHFDDVVAKLTQEAASFDAVTVRDQLRATVPGVDIRYGDVFSELWHHYRKGGFAQQYLIRTKTVLANGRTDITVEYVPAATTTLQKVRKQWAAADLRTSAAPAVNAESTGCPE